MKQKNLLKTMLLLCALIVGSGTMWGQVVSGTTYNTTSTSSLPNGWSGSDGGGTSYIKLTASTHYIQTSSFTQNGFTSIKLKARKFGGPSAAQALITVSWYDASTSAETVLGTIAPTSTDLTDYTISSPTNPTGNTTGYIKIQCKGASSSKGSGVSQVTVTYTAGVTKTLSSITATAPTKTAYKQGETLDLTGMVVTAKYDDNSTEDVTSKCTFSPANGTTLETAGSPEITVTYEGKEAKQAITVAGVTGLTVKTTPKTQYKYGETLDLSGLVLTATYSDSGTKDLAEGFTAAPASGSELTASGNITLTYYGQTCTQAYTVGTLSSLTYNDGVFANITYTEKDHFDPTGLVVTAHYTNGITEAVTDYTLSPSTTDELATTNTVVTVSYTWAGTEKTVDIPITVNAGTKYTVSFDAGNGTYTGGDITETAYQGGITLLSATAGVAGWVFAGWATATVGNTNTRPTLYAAGSTYYPTANCTLYAVYMLSDAVNKYRAATANSDIVDGLQVVISAVGTSYEKTLGNNNGTIVDINNFTPDVNGEITCANSQALWTLSITNGNVIISNNGKSLKRSTSTLSLDDTGTNWTISKASYGTNRFYIKASDAKYYLEHDASSWTIYYLNNNPTSSGTTSYYGLTIYVPVQTAYNSNPDAIITPTIEFEKGDATLYLDGTNTYTNTATSDPAKAITYTSSDEDVATVTSAGVVTAVGIGTATITASVEKELGISNAAQATYDVTVKSTTTIAGIKGVNSTTTATSFTADLTDANITYVSGTHAYIQDASAAIYVSCATNDWRAGKKFTGAVSGKVKKSYGVWEITEFTGTLVEGGTVPAALTDVAITDITSETYASYEGKKITLTGVTVTAAMASTATSGGEVSDGTNTIKIGAPAKGITLVKDERGSVTGFVAQYSGTYRLNLYEPSQFVKTHNAPVAQTLTFTEDVFNIDEDTNDFTNFAPQEVSGAQGTVTYAIANTSGDVIYENFNTADGTFTLKTQAYGTATITATAAAANITVGGVTTPYTETTKSYTVTVYPRYTSMFSINGDVTAVRQATHGAAITVPTPAATIGDYSFVGWTESTINGSTDNQPTMVTPPTTPTSNVTYYAVYAIEAISTVEQDKTSTLTIKQSSSPGSPYTNNGVTWTFSGLTFASSNNCGMPNGASVTFTLPDSKVKTKSVQAVKTQDWSTSNISIALTDASSASISTFNNAFTYNFTESNNSSSAYTLTATNQSSKTAWISSIVVTYTDLVDAITYSGYRTTIPSATITLNAACTDGTLYYGTYSNSSAFIVPSDLIVSEIGVVDDQLVVEDYDTGDIVPANTGVMVSSDVSGDHTVILSSATGTSKLGTDNCLRPTGDGITADAMTAADASCLFYRLTMHNADPANNVLGTIGFYWGAANGAAFAVVANKAYLAVPKTVNARMGLWFGDATGIADANLNVNDNDNRYFDLQGRRVDNPKKGGLYIVNGKKQIMK